MPEIGLLRVLDQLPGFLLVTDRDLRVTGAHGRAFAEVDARPEEVVGRTLAELMADDPARELVVSVYRRVLGGRSDRFEYRLARTGRLYDTRVEPLRADDGRVVGAAGLAIDVTERRDASERRRADAILAAVRAAAEQLLQSDALGVELPALLGRIGEATRASRVYVFDRHEAADGAPVWSQRYEWVAEGVTPLLDAPELQEFRYGEHFGRWAEAFEREEVIAGPVRGFPDGERIALEPDGIRSILVAPITVAGDWVGYIGLDDCEREREWSVAEADALQAAARILGAAIRRLRSDEALRESEARRREAQKLEAIGRVAGGIAHDFNNLLMIILGCSESALEELDPDSAVRGELEDIRDAAEQAATLTRGLLAFGRRQELRPVTVDLNDAVEAAAGMLRRLLPDEVRLELELEAGLPQVRVDPAQLSQVIMNLAVNARDAMPHGGRLIVATARDDAGFAVLTVADEGSGMAPEVAARAFEPFFTTKAPGRGTGLGLATVHGVVTQSGGRISVDSAPGAGTTVTVLLPRAA